MHDGVIPYASTLHVCVCVFSGVCVCVRRPVFEAGPWRRAG